MVPDRNSFFSLIFFLLAASSSVASANDFELETIEDENLISLYGTACEVIKPDELKSSVRVRATDKASFTAVENIAELSDYRNSFSGHDFNVLIYNIVDNYVEDLAVRTTKQTAEELCVEVTGYLNAENILKSLNENYQKLAAAEKEERAAEPQIRFDEGQYPEALEIEDENALKIPVVSNLPPKPQIALPVDDASDDDRNDQKIHKLDSQQEVVPEKTNGSALMSQEPSQKIMKDEILVEAETMKKLPQQQFVDTTDDHQNNTLVFIDKTRFFNDTATNRYHDDVKDLLKDMSGVEVIRDKNKADYIIKPKVLRAKVDPINAQTNRLQLVVALELVDTANGNTVVEHQNRFILFGSDENEQNVASSLMKKLIKKAGDVITAKIPATKTSHLNGSGSIITPTISNYGYKK